jgi:CYTH domain-containing protein
MSEVERKFRVASVPDGLGGGARLRQAYVAIDGGAGVEVRVRDEDGTRTLTVKGGAGLERAEVEVPLGAEAFDELWALAGDRRIDKVRHRLPLASPPGGPAAGTGSPAGPAGPAGPAEPVGPAGPVAELDLYAGRLDGLAVVEVEFPDRAAAERFTPPDWFGAELTGRPGWSNAALATSGSPPADD